MHYVIRVFSLLVTSILYCYNIASAQVVRTEPSPAVLGEPVTIIFNAELGSRGLQGYSGDVYAHTGVITNLSSGDSDWRYVKTNWGQNTPATKLERQSANIYHLTINDIRAYYGVPATEEIIKLSFVFRSAASPYLEGKGDNGSDIFVEVANPALNVRFLQPELPPTLVSVGSQLRLVGKATSAVSTVTSIELYVNNTLTSRSATSELDTVFTFPNDGLFTFTLVARDDKGSSDTAQFSISAVPAVTEQARPAGISEGVNKVNDSTVILCLFAPRKNNVFVIGDFNDWQILPQYQMKKHTIDADSVYWWLEISNLQPTTEYAFQYIVNGTLRIADPFSEKLLDESNDPEIIAQNRYPNLKPYPRGKTSEYVGVFTINKPAYQWQIENFRRPAVEKLVVYELLVRDFTNRRTFQAVIDSLDYLQNLGVNVLQLMPIQEFDGNLSWGYNPSFFFAVDKYYGTENDLKRLIDECHKRGIAVVLDVVLNHVTGASPFVRLYASGNYGPATADNPWANPVAKHPFNVFNDLNHESPQVQKFVDRFNKFWIQEFKVDGFRYDLSKGFTQRQSNSVDSWSRYDSSRVLLLKRMSDKIRAYDTSAYLILEHFADNREETELSSYGYLLWGNMNRAYSQAGMGWIADNSRSSDFSWTYYKNRGWSKPGVVSYMESHDEERMMVRNFCFGRQSPAYNTRDTATALQRMGLNAAFFFPVPGPKMIWQFGEIGYDVPLLNNCEANDEGKLSIKPTRWQYLQDERRSGLLKTYSALIKLATEYPTFHSTETEVRFYTQQGVAQRAITFSHPSMNAVVIGNFGIERLDVNPRFLKTGTWYNFATADSISVSDINATVSLAPGEFRLFTDKPLPKPDIPVSVEENIGDNIGKLVLYPNPANEQITISGLSEQSIVSYISISDITGKIVFSAILPIINGTLTTSVSGIPTGTYIVTLRSPDGFIQSLSLQKQ